MNDEVSVVRLVESVAIAVKVTCCAHVGINHPIEDKMYKNRGEIGTLE